MGLFDNSTSSNSTSTQVTNTTNSPYNRRYLDTALGRAMGLFNRGTLSPFVGRSRATTQGLQGMLGQARRNIPTLASALGVAGSLATGSGDISSAMQQDIYGRSLKPSYAETNLADVASGKQIGGNDPNFERLRQRAIEDAATEAGMVASGMGRTGSDYHQSAVARETGDLAAKMDYQRLQDQEGRQMQANSLMDAARQAGLGLGLNAANSATSVQGENQNRRLSGALAVPGLAEATMSPYETMKDVGEYYRNDLTNNAAHPANNVGALMALLGQTNPFGTQTSTTTGTQSGAAQGPDNTAGGILGLGLGGLSILKALGGLDGFGGFSI